MLSAVLVSAQPNTFQTTYDVGDFDFIGSVDQLTNDHYLLSGSDVLGLFGGGGGTLLQVDDLSQVVWANQYSNVSFFYDARQTSDGGHIAAGIGADGGIFGSGDQDALLVKTTSTGAVTWSTGYGGTGLN